MSDKEMIELDAWLAEHAMGWRRVEEWQQSETPEIVSRVESDGLTVVNSPWRIKDQGVYFQQWKFFSPTKNPSDAMEVLKKCCEKRVKIYTQLWSGLWLVADGEGIIMKAETLELAICLYAQALFKTELERNK